MGVPWFRQGCVYHGKRAGVPLDRKTMELKLNAEDNFALAA